MRLLELVKSLLKRVLPSHRATPKPKAVSQVRGPLTHVVILDGTMSSLVRGEETNAGLTYRMLREVGPRVSLFYEAGLQWADWRTTQDVILGRGINRQITRAYGYLASRYRPGDRIFLMGYSRGAYAVRSLGGVIDRIGLLKAEHATSRNIMLAYRHYQKAPDSHYAQDFRAAYCHDEAMIEMVGVWDTVKALGTRLPFLRQWHRRQFAFHNHQLGGSMRRGFQALALDETRIVFEPVIWESPPEREQDVEQVWFRGTHPDIGGQIGSKTAARPLANIPLVWMLEQGEKCGLPLPDGWRDRYAQDANAPSVGTWTGWGVIFFLRRARVVGRDPSERLHESVPHPEATERGGQVLAWFRRLMRDRERPR